MFLNEMHCSKKSIEINWLLCLRAEQSCICNMYIFACMPLLFTLNQVFLFWRSILYLRFMNGLLYEWINYLKYVDSCVERAVSCSQQAAHYKVRAHLRTLWTDRKPSEDILTDVNSPRKLVTHTRKRQPTFLECTMRRGKQVHPSSRWWWGEWFWGEVEVGGTRRHQESRYAGLFGIR